MEAITRRARRTHQQIIDSLELFKTSGRSVKDFCLEQGIKPASFHKWQSRTRNKIAKQASTGFAKVHIEQGGVNMLFAEVGRIRLYQVVPASYLKELSQ